MIRLALAAALAAAAIASPAAAQAVGTYTGTAADGSYVSFIVDRNTSNELQLRDATFIYTVTCQDGSKQNPNWSFGVAQPIVDGKISYTTASSSLAVGLSLRFGANGKEATGKFYSYVPTLSPIGPHPTKAKLCVSPQQTFTVTYQKPATTADPALPPGAAVTMEKSYHAAVGPKLDD